jgi:hypothetical protein
MLHLAKAVNDECQRPPHNQSEVQPGDDEAAAVAVDDDMVMKMIKVPQRAERGL